MNVPKLLRTALFSVSAFVLAAGLAVAPAQAQEVTVNEDDGDTIAGGLADLDDQAAGGDGAATLTIIAGDYTDTDADVDVNADETGNIDNITDLTIRIERDGVDGVNQTTIESLDINTEGSVENVDITSDGNGFLFVQSGNANGGGLDDADGESTVFDFALKDGTLSIASAGNLVFENPANSGATNSELEVYRRAGSIDAGAPDYNGAISRLEYDADGNDITAGNELGTTSPSTSDISRVETLAIENNDNTNSGDLVTLGVQSLSVTNYEHDAGDEVEVDGSLTASSGFTNSGSLVVDGNLDLSDVSSPSANAAVTVNSTGSANGDLTAGGALSGVGGTIDVAGNLDVSGTYSNTGGETLVDGDLRADGDVENTGGRIDVAGTIEIDGGRLIAGSNVNGGDVGSPSTSSDLEFTGTIDRSSGNTTSALVDANGNTVVLNEVSATLQDGGNSPDDRSSTLIKDNGNASTVEINTLDLNVALENSGDGDGNSENIVETISANSSSSSFLINDVQVEEKTGTSSGMNTGGTDQTLVDIDNDGTFTVAGDLNAVDNSGSSNTLTLNAQPGGSTTLSGQLDNSGSSNTGTVKIAGDVDYDLVAAGGVGTVSGAIDNTADGTINIQSGNTLEIDVADASAGVVLANNGGDQGVSGDGALDIVSTATDGNGESPFEITTVSGESNELDVAVTTDVATRIEDGGDTGDATAITVGNLTTRTDGSAENGSVIFAEGNASSGIGDVTTGSITAGGNVTFGSDGNSVGGIETGAIDANSGGDVTFGDGAGTGDITTGNVTANAAVNFGESSGGDVGDTGSDGAIDTGTLTARSGGSITVNNVSDDSKITTGAITTNAGGSESSAGTITFNDGGLSTPSITANAGTVDLSGLANTVSTVSSSPDANAEVTGTVDVIQSDNGTNFNITGVEVHISGDLLRDGDPNASIVTGGSTSIIRFVGTSDSEFDTGSRFEFDGDLIAEKADAEVKLTGAVDFTGNVEIVEPGLANTNTLDLRENLFLTQSDGTVSLGGSFVTDSDDFLVVLGNGKTFERPEGDATLPNLRVNDSDGSSDAVTIASDLEFGGNVVLEDGGITIDATKGTNTGSENIDFAPTGGSSKITRFLDGGSTKITEANADTDGEFNIVGNEYDLVYDATSLAAGDAGDELTSNVADLTVKENATLQLDRNVMIDNGTLTVESGAGISDDETDNARKITLANGTTHSITGAIKGVNGSKTNPVTVDVTAQGATLQGDATDGNDEVTLKDESGSDVTVSGSEVENLTVNASNVSVENIQQITGELDVQSGAGVSLSLAIAGGGDSDPDTDQTVKGSGIALDGSLTLEAPVDVTAGGVTVNADGSIGFGSSDLTVSGGNFSSASSNLNDPYTNSGGGLVLDNNGMTVSTSGQTIGNVTVNDDLSLAGDVSTGSSLDVSDEIADGDELIVDLDNNTLTATGTVTLNGVTSSDGDTPEAIGDDGAGSGTLDVSSATIEIGDGVDGNSLMDGNANQKLDDLTVTGDSEVALASTGSSARTLEVGTQLNIETDANGSLNLQSNDVDITNASGFVVSDDGDGDSDGAATVLSSGGYLAFDAATLTTDLARGVNVDRLQVLSGAKLGEDGQTFTVDDELWLDAQFDADANDVDGGSQQVLAIGDDATIRRTEGDDSGDALTEAPDFGGDVDVIYTTVATTTDPDQDVSSGSDDLTSGPELPDANDSGTLVDLTVNLGSSLTFEQLSNGNRPVTATGTVDLVNGTLTHGVDGGNDLRRLALADGATLALRRGDIEDNGSDRDDVSASSYTLRYYPDNSEITTSEEEFLSGGAVTTLEFTDGPISADNATDNDLSLDFNRTVGAVKVDRSGSASEFNLSSNELTVSGSANIIAGTVSGGGQTLDVNGTSGDLAENSDVRVNGTLSDALEAAGKTFVTADGSISGDVTAEGDLEVAGSLSSTDLTVEGNVLASSANSFDPTDVTTQGTSDQKIELPSDLTVDFFTVNKTTPSEGSVPTVTVSGGDLKADGTTDDDGNVTDEGLDLDNGVLVTDGARVILPTGFDRGDVDEADGDASHVAGTVERTIDSGSRVRTTYPVGTVSGNYRFYQLIFPDGITDATIAVSHVPENPGSVNGLPAEGDDGVTIGTDYPDYYWTVETSQNLGLSQNYEVAARGNGLTFNSDQPVEEHRLISRNDVSDSDWGIVGNSSDYNNTERSADGEANIRSTSTTGNLTTQGTRFTVGVPAGDAPQIATNEGLTLTEGESAPITSTELEAQDGDNADDELTFEVTSGPSQGEIQVDGSQSSTFTQADVNNEVVSYNHTASNNDNDSFELEVSDPNGNSVNATFNVTVEQGLVAISGSVEYPTEGDGSFADGPSFSGGGFEVVATPSSGGEQLTAKPDENGAFTIDGASPGTDYDVSVDVTASVDPGLINVFDAQRVVNGSIGRTPFISSLQEEVADVTNDDNITSRDGLAILLNGGDEPFEAGEWATTDQTVTAGTDEEASLQVAQYGDANLRDTGDKSKTTLALSESEQSEAATSTAASAAASDADVKAEAGETFEVPVRVEGDASIGAYDLQFSYDEENVSFEGASVASGELFTDSEEGTVGVSWLDKTGESPLSASGGSPVVTLSFTAEEGAEEESLGLEVSDGRMTDPSGSTIRGATLSAPTVSVGAVAPEEFALKGNYPNPVASGQATIEMDLPSNASVTVEVYNTLGQQVMSTSQSMQAGSGQTVKVDGSQLSSGQYFYRVKANLEESTVRETGRMTVVR